MGFHGTFKDGKWTVDRGRNGTFSWSKVKTVVSLRNCPECETEQIVPITGERFIYSMYVGAGSYGMWNIVCRNCGYATTAKTEAEAARLWNDEAEEFDESIQF